VHLTSFQPLVPNVYILNLWVHQKDPVMYAVDTGGTFWCSDDAGAHWAALDSSRRMLVQQGRWMERQRQWLFCAPATYSVQCSADGGKTWHEQEYGAATGCSAGAILADGSLLMACEDTTPTAPPYWQSLMRLAPGATTWSPLGTVPYTFVLTTTGQLWGSNPLGGAPYVATLAP
jgi:hypothetical protein